MPITVPNLDDRTYRQLVAEALGRVPVHNPEWTNFNDSDPGVTLVQLFAFLTESLLYRANQIPERNRKKFLTLLGIGLKPAASAIGFVTIQNERGPLESRPVQADLDVRAGAIHFRTTFGLDVLPIEARAFIKAPLPEPQTDAERETRERFQLLYADLLEGPERQPAFYATMPLPEPAPGVPLPAIDLVEKTVDGCLWIALLARPTDLSQDSAARRLDLERIRNIIAGQPLTLGVMPGATLEGLDLRAGETSTLDTDSSVVWEIAEPPPDGQLPVSSNPDARKPQYKASLAPRGDGMTLRKPGLVELTLPEKINVWQNLEPAEEGTGDFPPSMADTNIGDRVLTWLRIKTARTGGTPPTVVGWVGVNATMIEQRTHVTGESLGEGNGEPDQQVTLANTPVVPGSLRLTVGGGEPWDEVDDLLVAEAEVPVGDPRLPLFSRELPARPDHKPLRTVYALDPESGIVTFGNGAHGERPGARLPIVASYSFGGGITGNMAIGAVNRATDLPASYKALNPLPTWGGSNSQTVAEAEQTIPREVKHKDRLVSVDDFREITWQTPGVDMGRVEVLPLYDASAALAGVPGAVTVVVIPRFDPIQPDAPVPDNFFLERVCRYLEPRRLVTTELFIRGPLYKNLWVTVGIEVLGGHAAGPVIDNVRRRLREFLSPLTGGREMKG